jgi:hypothetical protein
MTMKRRPNQHLRATEPSTTEANSGEAIVASPDGARLVGDDSPYLPSVGASGVERTG